MAACHPETRELVFVGDGFRSFWGRVFPWMRGVCLEGGIQGWAGPLCRGSLCFGDDVMLVVSAEATKRVVSNANYLYTREVIDRLHPENTVLVMCEDGSKWSS